MSDQILQILIQGGLTSVALASLYVNFRLVSNHFTHSDNALKELTKVLSELKQVVSDKLNGKKYGKNHR